MSEEMQLRNPDIEPTSDLIGAALGNKVYAVYEELMSSILPALELIPEWRYYNDGKAWLCKVVNKKKTVFWLSIWDGYFKTSFFYTEKNCGGIAGLNIDENIKIALVRLN